MTVFIGFHSLFFVFGSWAPRRGAPELFFGNSGAPGIFPMPAKAGRKNSSSGRSLANGKKFRL